MTTQSLFQSIGVLVVDDSAYMRRLLHGLLNALEVEKIYLAANGEEGINLYCRHAQDAGITTFLSKPISSATLYRKLAEVACHPQSFIETPSYRGPDRRWRDLPFDGMERRRAVPSQVSLIWET